MSKILFLFIIFSTCSSYGMFKPLSGMFGKSTHGMNLLHDYQTYFESGGCEEYSETYRTFIKKVGRINALHREGFFPWLMPSLFRCKSFDLKNIIVAHLVHLSTLRVDRSSMLDYASQEEREHVVALIEQFIQREKEYPGYVSFFHATDGCYANFLDLQKKLYEKEHGLVHRPFEFLRLIGNREHLRDLSKEEFLEARLDIHDESDPDRTDLLSVTTEPWFWQTVWIYTVSRSWFGMRHLNKWIYELCKSYKLPVVSVKALDLSLKKGIILHLLLKKECADRLVYGSAIYGTPVERKLTSLQRLFPFAKRIVLDPKFFDEENDDVLIFRHQNLSDVEKREYEIGVQKLVNDMIVEKEARLKVS